MSEPTPIPASQAARMIRRMSKPEPPKTTATELGLAIASLAIGVLVAISAVPAGVLLGTEHTAITLIPIFAFAVISVILGTLGRRNAMGVAGFVLGAIAVVEAVSVYGYLSYQQEKERQALVAQEKERTKQAQEKTRLAEIELDKKRADTAKQIAENEAEKMERAKEQELRLQLKLTQEEKEREQQFALFAQQREKEEAEREIREREIRRQTEIERRESETRRKERAITEKTENLRLLEKLVSQYTNAAQDYKNVSLQVKAKYQEIQNNQNEIKSLEVRIKNLRMILEKLTYEDPQRKKYESEENRIHGILKEKNKDLYVPSIASFNLEPNANWKEIATLNENISNLLLEDLGDRYTYTGNRLARIHNAILGAINELSLNDYQSKLLSAGAELLQTNKPKNPIRNAYGSTYGR